MKVLVTKKIGKAQLQFQVEGEKEKDTLYKASAFTTIPDKCGNCESENVVLDANKSEDFVFIKVKCLDCNYRSNMGELKAGGVFWKQWEEYVAPAKVKDKEVKKEVKQEEDMGEIPF